MRLWIPILAVAISGCADQKKKSSSSAPKPAVNDSSDINTDDANPSLPTLQVTSASGGTMLNMVERTRGVAGLVVSGAGGKTVALGLLAGPQGVRLEGASTANPSLVWDTPIAGLHRVVFVLRDMNLCQSQGVDCTLPLTPITATGASYDAQSAEFSLEVQADPNSSPGLANGDMISTIMGLLNGDADLSSILASLSQGQLQGVLNSASSGSLGGLDLGQIIQFLFGGMSLDTGAYDPYGASGAAEE